MDRVDYDSEHTTPPNLGDEFEELAEEMDGVSRDDLEAMMDDMLDQDEHQLAYNPATPPANPFFAVMALVPDEEKQEVGLYVGETEEYVELGITYADEFYRPWIGKWRSNGEGEVFYPVDVADGGFPAYELDLDAWPETVSPGDAAGDFTAVRPLNDDEKAAVNEYLDTKQGVLAEYDADEVPDQLAEPRQELEDAFSHLHDY